MSIEPSMRMVRVIVVASEQPGRLMAGPAIRAVEWARALQDAGVAVQLVVRAAPDVDLGVPVKVIGPPTPVGYRALAQDCDVVVTQPQRVDVAAGLHRGGARVLYDMYVPSYVEYPSSVLAGPGPPRTKHKLVERNQREYATAIDCGDGFLVASERQRAYLLGALGQAGRLMGPPKAHLEAFPRVVVAPFGLPDVVPDQPADHPLRGTLVPDDSVILLWAGGVWNWFDPDTLMRGLELARRRDPRLRLVFLGVGHPSDAFTGQSAAPLRSPLAERLVAAGAVTFVDRWVPHDERWAFLADADAGVCAHFDSPETFLSYRTRLLDHLWAGLPTLTTAGGVLGDLIVERGAGMAVSAGSEVDWADVLLRFAGDEALRSGMSTAARLLAPAYRWSAVAAPMLRLVSQLAAGDAGPRRRPSAAAVVGYLAVALENRLR